MMHLLAVGVSRPSLTWQYALPTSPAIPLWLVAIFFVFALGLIAYLTIAQYKITSLPNVLFLTFIRLALVALLFLMMLQPTLKWVLTTENAGTLWVVLDQSGSMACTDPQASPVEKLRWAESLNYLPASKRPSHLDVQLARLQFLRESLRQLKPPTSAIVAAERDGPAADAAAATRFGDQLKAWNDQFEPLIKTLDADPGAAGSNLGNDARDVHRMVARAADNAPSAKSLRRASESVPWNALENKFANALIRDTAYFATRADQSFLATHAGDSDVVDAFRRLDGVSRADLAYADLTNTDLRDKSLAPKTLASLFPKYHVKVVSFADTAQAAPSIDQTRTADAFRSALRPGGKATNIASALRLVNDQVAQGEHAAVIVLSDGRQNVTDDPADPARQLAARGVNVYALLVGSYQVSPDAAVDQVDAPEWIFKDDTLRASAQIRLDGLAGKRLKVELRRNGQVVDTQSVIARNTATQDTQSDVQTLTFADKPPDVGVYDYEVRVETVATEINKENNAQNFRVAIKKDRLNALLIEDQPRWEYQYLRGLLGRGAGNTLKLQTVLLSPAHIADVAAPAPIQASPDNPREEAQLLPQTKQEWEAFDFIILGDVPPSALSPAQQQHIATAVRERGATLLVVAGQHYMPHAYANSPLADLLPVTPSPIWDQATLKRHRRDGFRPALAPEGAASVLGQFGADPASNAALWSHLPVWYWHSEWTRAKPAATPLWSLAEPDAQADATLTAQIAARERVLLASMDVPLGRVLFVGSDQTWRFRQVDGLDLQDQFWKQVIRWAVGSDLPAGGRFVRFGASRQRYKDGEPVAITIRVLKENMTPYTGLKFDVVARLVTEKELRAGTTASAKVVNTASVQESPDSPGFYRATFASLPPGLIEISLKGDEPERLLNSDPSAAAKTLLIPILAQLDLEHRNMNTDRRMLASITEAGGGATLDAPHADVLASLLPAVTQTRTSTDEIGFFADPHNKFTLLLHAAFLLLFAALLTTEWVIRKRAGMI